VDDIHDTEEIVVKPLQKQLKGINAFAGATIMGDGKVALILDVLGLAQRANVVSGTRERALAEKPAAAEKDVDRHTVLLCTTSHGGRIGIPLSLVARLEEFPRAQLERTGAKNVVQYRDVILPLVDVGRVLRDNERSVDRRARRLRQDGRHPAPDAVRGAAERKSDTVQVVVYSSDHGRIGLVVDRIIDIVEETIVIRSRASRPGVLYTAVIQGRVTEFLDVEGIVRAANPEMAARAGVS
jgi:two-component system chemotaxis sensor kinase CheA